MPAALWFAIGAAILCAITSVYLGRACTSAPFICAAYASAA